MTSQKWVLITGANGGIGQALVWEFIAAGYSVIATDSVDKDPFQHEKVKHQALDLTELATDEGVAAEFLARISQATNQTGISALVNNAAIQRLASSRDVTRSDWAESLAVNLSAPFFLIQLFLEQLERNHGAVVNISSIHATQTKQRFVTYATTKGALSTLTRSLAVDLRDRIRINAIEPAAVRTEMLDAGFIGREEELRKLEELHPAGRIAEPQEIAELAVFLCSEKAQFVHGACINASGGIHGGLLDPAPS